MHCTSFTCTLQICPVSPITASTTATPNSRPYHVHAHVRVRVAERCAHKNTQSISNTDNLFTIELANLWRTLNRVTLARSLACAFDWFKQANRRGRTRARGRVYIMPSKRVRTRVRRVELIGQSSGRVCEPTWVPEQCNARNGWLAVMALMSPTRID